MPADISSEYLILGFIGTIIVSSVVNSIVSKIIARKPEPCGLHEISMKEMRDERVSLAEEVQDSKKHMDALTECFHKLDKKIDIFIETSKLRQDIIVELSGAIKTIAAAFSKGQHP